MNLTEPQNVEDMKQKQARETVNKFDLAMAYRLLIGAYIRSTIWRHKSAMTKAENQADEIVVRSVGTQ